ncbi:MAG: hypothetical protein ACTSP4_15240 [Candidatus Hodarchaeales archaeon]
MTKKKMLSIIANDVSLSILTEIIKSKHPLSIHDFSKNYSLSQYRYTIRQLQTYSVLSSFRKKKRLYYGINSLYREKIAALLENSGDFVDTVKKAKISHGSISTLFTRLRNFSNSWALTGPHALIQYVPFLNLSPGRYTISVKSVKMKQKITSITTQELVDVLVQPSYFIRRNSIVHVKNNPVLAPSPLLFQLLKDQNARVRLASVFLLPYINPGTILSKITRERKHLLTVVYLLFSLREYLTEQPEESLMRKWFYNFDQYDTSLFFEHAVKFSPATDNSRTKQRKAKRTSMDYTQLRAQWKKKMNESSKWDIMAELFREKRTRLDEETIESLIHQ